MDEYLRDFLKNSIVVGKLNLYLVRDRWRALIVQRIGMIGLLSIKNYFFG